MYADPDTLNGMVEFDSPFIVTAIRAGQSTWIERSTQGVWAPDVLYAPGRTPDVEIHDHRHDWKPWLGASNQQGYSGPIMHASEQLAGGMAQEVLAKPGIYCVVEVRDEDYAYPEGEWIGWALVYIEEGATS